MTLTPRRKIALGVAAAVLALGGVGAMLSGGDAPAAPVDVAPAAGPTSNAPAAAASDPYTVYLASNPRPGLVLSREDAATRAYLGCGHAWAPGTVDAVLAAAYRPTGICG